MRVGKGLIGRPACAPMARPPRPRLDRAREAAQQSRSIRRATHSEVSEEARARRGEDVTIESPANVIMKVGGFVDVKEDVMDREREREPCASGSSAAGCASRRRRRACASGATWCSTAANSPSSTASTIWRRCSRCVDHAPRQRRLHYRVRLQRPERDGRGDGTPVMVQGTRPRRGDLGPRAWTRALVASWTSGSTDGLLSSPGAGHRSGREGRLRDLSGTTATVNLGEGDIMCADERQRSAGDRASVVSAHDTATAPSPVPGPRRYAAGFMPKPFAPAARGEARARAPVFGADVDLHRARRSGRSSRSRRLEDARTWAALGAIYDNSYVSTARRRGLEPPRRGARACRARSLQATRRRAADADPCRPRRADWSSPRRTPADVGGITTSRPARVSKAQAPRRSSAGGSSSRHSTREGAQPGTHVSDATGTTTGVTFWNRKIPTLTPLGSARRDVGKSEDIVRHRSAATPLDRGRVR